MTDVNHLIAVGSVDGTIASTVCLRVAKNPDIPISFTQAHALHEIKIEKWLPGRNIGIIDLGVCEKKSPSISMLTVEFVKKIYDHGHTISFIADEHGKEAWKKTLQSCDKDITSLRIQPEDRGSQFSSSCAVLMKALGTSDEYTSNLLLDGNQADLGNFDTRYGNIFNKAIKSQIKDSERRCYLARYMSDHEEPDETIKGWVQEYEVMEGNIQKVLDKGASHGEGIRYYSNAEKLPLDITAFLFEAYKKSSIVLISTHTYTIVGTENQDLNLPEILSEAKIPVAGGLKTKASFKSDFVDQAIRAIKTALEKLKSPSSSSSSSSSSSFSYSGDYNPYSLPPPYYYY
jgi:hypothetical protein